MIESKNMHTVYIVEDDQNISELLDYALKNAGFNTVIFTLSADLFSSLHKNPLPDILLLDIMLPDEDGLSILRKIRKNSKISCIPIIMLTAKGSELDKIKGLNAGADDYVTKPFSVMELTSRIHAVLRRSIKDKKNILKHGGIELDTQKHSVTVNKKSIYLTLKEYELLRYLMQNAQNVLSREKIIGTVWNYNNESETRTVDAHIKILRKKLEDAGTLIQTVRGVGYKLGG